MAGELTPLTLIPRYTTYSGTASYTTIALEVTAFEKAIVNIFRNAMLGSVGNPAYNLEESSDQVLWSVCAGTGADFNPPAGTETQYNATLTKRWFRIRLALPYPDNVLTCYAVGFLEERLS